MGVPERIASGNALETACLRALVVRRYGRAAAQDACMGAASPPLAASLINPVAGAAAGGGLGPVPDYGDVANGGLAVPGFWFPYASLIRTR